MTFRTLSLLIMCLLFFIAGGYYFTPWSSNLSEPVTFVHEAHTMTIRKKFKLEGRVLSTRRYHLDWQSKVSPVDVAIGWGRMADDNVVRTLRISQANRWAYWKGKGTEVPISVDEIRSSCANLHMIPATDLIKQRLLYLKPNDVVLIKGDLVDVTSPNGLRWETSLSWTDTGPDSCEIVFVEQIERLSPK